MYTHIKIGQQLWGVLYKTHD